MNTVAQRVVADVVQKKMTASFYTKLNSEDRGRDFSTFGREVAVLIRLRDFVTLRALLLAAAIWQEEKKRASVQFVRTVTVSERICSFFEFRLLS